MKPTLVIIGGGNSFSTYEEYLADLNYWDARFFDDSTGWKTIFYRELSSIFTVLMPTMPNKNNAVYSEWKMVFEKFALVLSPDTIYIGHSLGGIFLAKYFSENILNASAIHLIAAPFSSCGSMTLGSDVSKLASLNDVHLWHSRDDSVVDFSELFQYQKALPNANVHIFEDRKHFNGERFDELMNVILKK
jgi:predicted alpha/beta hydrolase family esterase